MDTPITVITPEVRKDATISLEEIEKGEFTVLSGGIEELEEFLDNKPGEGRTD